MGKVKDSIFLCEDCGSERLTVEPDDDFDPIDPRPVTYDMMDFINKQEHWAEREAPSIAWGMLYAVFQVIFTIAPNQEGATKLITECLDNFLDGENGKA